MILSLNGIIAGKGINQFLLDDYPNATLAYSLRKLRKNYLGSAITVRRSSDNSSLDIGFNSNGDLDTISLLNFVGASNGYIPKWYDQSGNGNNASILTSSYQPQIVSSGSLLTINGKACIRFDGIDDNFAISSPVTYITGDEFSTFHVEKKTAESSNGIWITGGSSFYGGYTPVNTNAGIYMSSQLNASTSNYSGAALAGNPHRLISGFLRTNAINTQLFVNNSLITFTASGTETRASSFSVMGSRVGEYSNTSVQEFIMYKSNQSMNNIDINNKINQYYTIY